MIPNIENYFKENNTKLLDNSFKENIEKELEGTQIKYKVINLKNNSSYGTLENINLSREDIINKINTNSLNDRNDVTEYIPIINKDLYLNGVILLKYPLKVTANNISDRTISIITTLIVISPFIYIILFTYIFGLKLAKNINDPLNKLKEASKKIQNKDLDFKLDYKYNNELYDVVKSFEDMRKELKDTLDKEWALEEERKEIIGGLSHDLRSPLTVIKGKLDLLLEGAYKNEDRLLKYLDSIEKSTDRAIVLVEDLNRFNKLESAEFKINPSEENIKVFLTEKVYELKSITDEKDINLNLKLIGIDDSTKFTFDKESISRVLDNIIMNSIRYVDKKGSINIAAELNNKKLEFTISDNGCGFSKKDLKYALNKFYRGDESRGTNMGNSGLGLYICKVIIEKHNGKIVLSNSDNGGAKIQFFIENMN
nr:HAMP domain-containing sensor histidine kinase [Clostridium baratii]